LEPVAPGLEAEPVTSFPVSEMICAMPC
jgi:hypothetical protein